jgi:hypothetical protein
MNPISSHPLYKPYTIDSAMNSLWDFYRKRFFVLFLISLVMSLITQYASTLIDFREIQSITDPEEMLLKLKEYIWPMVLISVLNLFFYNILQYYIIYSPLDKENNLPRCLINSTRYFIPYLIIMVLLVFFGSVALFLGLLALVIGIFFSVLYVMTIYLFILPVMMSEGPNIANTISRTFRLTHRSFWANIGWTAAFLLIILVVSVVLSGLVLLPFTGSFIKVFSNPDDPSALMDLAGNPIYIFLTAAVNALVFPLVPIFGLILYFNGCARENQAVVPDYNQDHYPDDKVKVEDLYAKPLPEDNPDETTDQVETQK